MNCDFAIINGVAKCRRPGCGREVHGATGRIAAPCRAPQQDAEQFRPGIWGMAVSYVRSQLEHLFSGSSVTEVERLARHDTCRGCPKYDSGRCLICGCTCNDGANPLVNKLATANPEWPVLRDAAGEMVFECPQLQRERESRKS